MNFKDIALGIGIIILTLFVVIYGFNTFYPKHEFNDFCPDVRTAEFINTSERCEETGGKWIVNENLREVGPVKSTGYCDRDYYCRQDYENAQEKRAMWIFIISIPLGVAIIGAGMVFFSLEAVGAGLMGGGVTTLIYGATNYWQYGPDWLRFLISLLGLAALIYIAYWFNSNQGKKKKK
ncbi:DUF2157 domain-containing protein [Candidatus Pacearchaeota archaeon]|nr:DUF2157 domain-containing protein [Candidatus Pacearchaeota archaeon]